MKYISLNKLNIYNGKINRLLENENLNTLNTLKELSNYISKDTKRQSNCPNCGAAIESEVCEYCGTNLRLIGVI